MTDVVQREVAGVAFTKDKWTRSDRQPDGTVQRVRTDRWGRGKRWLAVWTDPSGRGKSQAFSTKVAADRHGAAMETDRDRGDYVDPEAGRIRFEELAERWLLLRLVDPASAIQYESKWRLHVAPRFGRRQVKSIRPSDIATWLADLNERFGSSAARTAFLVLHGALELAVADELIKRNPAKSSIVQRPSRTQRDVVVWADEAVDRVIDALPQQYRCIPIIAAACGLRQGELFGLAVEDIDLDDAVIYVRRQVKRLGSQYVFARPKNDRERMIPLPRWASESIQAHLRKYGTVAVTLPWERTNGASTTVRLLFRSDSDKHLQARTFDEVIWKPALATAGLIPAPTKDARGRRRFVTARRTGIHALRHFYASVTLADGVNVKELAEYLGHHDPGFTLRLYTHMLPSSFDRARRAVDNRMLRRPRTTADGPGTIPQRSTPGDRVDSTHDGRTINRPLTCYFSSAEVFPSNLRAMISC